MKKLIRSLITAGLVALTGCEGEHYSWEEDERIIELDYKTFQTYSWTERHVTVRANSIYEAQLETENLGGSDIVNFGKWYNTEKIQGYPSAVTYATQVGSTNQLSPIVRFKSKYTGKVGDPDYIYPSTTISFGISSKHSDSGGFIPKKIYLKRIVEEKEL